MATTERSGGRASALSSTYWPSGQARERLRPEQDAEWRKLVQEEFVEHEGAQTGPERSGDRAVELPYGLSEARMNENLELPSIE